MFLVGFFPCAGKLDLRWDDQISRRFIFWDWQPTICCGDCLAWPSLLEPAHSSESECTSWTNRRIVLTKYHTARALEKLTLQVRLYWETMTRADGIMLLHKITLWRQRVSKLAASLPEYFAHAFSMTPSPQHSKMRKRSFPWTSCYCILFVHRRGIIIIIIIV